MLPLILEVALGAPTSDVLTPTQMQQQVGLGINLGNRIDLYQQPARPVKEQYFEDYKAKNFTNVRIPVHATHCQVFSRAS